ncbi:MAG: response regulator [gamma proteobacterium symbiont of Bathyaustriella thionipta]|nr:response regulator [gamma proteobacterium symbiont of Bathyaustriella thionipta]MCU7951326.1 response regulator [gamma proteobacterium symbiont of Bathyaustriella thionipta]MCU7957878.1 response regulator [gamma proteobacterium symbiont of Bathyaustriella thionipta]
MSQLGLHPFRTDTGGVVTGLLSAIPIRLGKQVFNLGMFVNLTERIKIEQALKKAKEESEQANEFKSHFLANMSHEIRTPMNAIIGMAYLALQTKLNEKQFDYINKLKFSADHLLGIINDILDFSKIEAGMLTLEKTEFKLDEVLEHLADIINLKASEKNIEILFRTDLSIPEGLVGDPMRLEQVLINLVQNAIKFTDKGEIVISSELIDDKNGMIQIAFSVADSGVGIEPEKLKHLFEAFIQADSSISRKHGGTGLGLSISKQIVEMMGGTLEVASEFGKGSVFSFTITIEKKRFSETKLASVKPDLKGVRVLVVDDNPVAQKILKEMLESLSFEVEVADSARQAFNLLEDNQLEGDAHSIDKPVPFSIVFMDWRMPEINGIEAVKHIQSKLLLSTMPKIILVTAYGRDEILKEAEKITMDGLLTKPINPSSLLDSIMSAMNSHVGIRKRRSRHVPNISDKRLKGKILVTEDNSINQQVAKELLEGFGLMVVIADNGQKAVNYVHESDFDLVIMDIQMPVMDGMEATRLIRMEEQFKQLPIIAMTAHAMEGDQESCIAVGMDDYLSKPIDPEKLYQMMIKWLDDGLTNKEAQSVNIEEVDIEFNKELSGIDLSWGLQRVGGNKHLFLKLLKDFKNKYENSYSQLNGYLDSNALEDARRLIHTIHGVAGNIGARKLQYSAQEIETSIRKNKIKDEYLSPLIDDFGQKAKTVFNELDKISVQWEKVIELNENNNQAKSFNARSDNKDELPALLNKLDELLLEGDSEAQVIIKSVKKLVNTRQQLSNDDLLLLIEQQIDDYEYDEARESLQQLNSLL